MCKPVFKAEIKEMGRYYLIPPITKRQELKAIFPRRYVTVPKTKDAIIDHQYHIGTEMDVVEEDGDFLFSAKVTERSPMHWWLYAPAHVSDRLYKGTPVLVYLAEDE